MFNMFNKKTKQENISNLDYKSDPKAIVTYFVDNDGKVVVDVSLEDYNEESLSALIKILDTLSDPQSYLETIHIVKEGFISSNNIELFNKLVGHLTAKTMKTQNRLIEKYQEIINHQPCIRPSEMMK